MLWLASTFMWLVRPIVSVVIWFCSLLASLFGGVALLIGSILLLLESGVVAAVICLRAHRAWDQKSYEKWSIFKDMDRRVRACIALLSILCIEPVWVALPYSLQSIALCNLWMQQNGDIFQEKARPQREAQNTLMKAEENCSGQHESCA
jgi:hypothetical protein